MSLTPRLAVAAAVFGLAAGSLAAQDAERPAVLKPRVATSRQDLDRREAQRLYALGTLQERKTLLVEAARSYEAARRLDPDSAAIVRALVPLYLALERHDDAFNACKRVLKLDPDDFQTAGLYARHLRDAGMHAEAAAVLARATKSSKLKDRPDLAAQVWFDLGMVREQMNDFKAAAASFGKLAAILDNTDAMLEASHMTRDELVMQAAEAHERVARVSLRAGDPDMAAKEFEKAQKADPMRATRLALNLSQVYAGQKKYKEALEQVEAYLRHQPQGTEAYELQATIQRKMGRSADVVPDLERAAGRDPNNLALKLLLAREYVKARQPRDAERIYLRLLDRQVAGEIYKGLFELYREQGPAGAKKVLDRLDKAVKAGLGDEKKAANAGEAASARAMLAVLKDDRELVPLLLAEAIARLKADEDREDRKLAYATRGFLASLAARTQQLDYAEKLYRSCLGELAGPREMEADVYSGLIRILKLRHKHQAVLDVCKTGLRKAQLTNRLLFHTEQGRAYQYLGKNDEAIRAFEQAVQEAGKPQKLQCKRLLIDALSVSGQNDKALAECKQLLKEYNQGGELRDVRATLSMVYQAMGKFDLADKQLQLVLESDPNDATANNDLGYVWADHNKNLEEAEKLIRKAIELDRTQRGNGLGGGVEADEDNAAYVDSLGWVLFRQGRLDEARTELEKATKMPGGDDDPTVWDHLADVYFRLKQADRAVVAWKKALSLYDQRTRRPQPERYREIQEKIEAVK